MKKCNRIILSEIQNSDRGSIKDIGVYLVNWQIKEEQYENGVVRKHRYCILHICENSECDNYKEKENHLCENCLAKEEETNKKKVKGTTSKKTTKRVTMPDCDDYDDYDDFMDDWDGFMPDGSDAEDYWEDW